MPVVPAPSLRRLAAATPAASSRRPGRRRASAPPRLRLVAAVAAELFSDGSGGELESARRRILRWVEDHAGPLPTRFGAGPGDGEVVRHRAGNALIQAIQRAPEHGPGPPSYFGVSFAVGFSGRWTNRETVLIVFRSGGASHLRAALFFSPQPGRVHAQIHHLPKIVSALGETPGLIDAGWRIRSTPWVVEDRASVEGLVHLIGDPNRTRPLIAVGLAPGETNPESAPVDPWDLARRTAGLAQVAVVTGPMTYALTDRVGRRFSVFGNAVRTYRPGCVIGSDALEHPMALAETVLRWPRGGAQEFALFLTRAAARASIREQAPKTGLPLEWDAQSAHGDLFSRALRRSSPGGGLHPLGAGVDVAEKPEEIRLPTARAG